MSFVHRDAQVNPMREQLGICQLVLSPSNVHLRQMIRFDHLIKPIRQTLKESKSFKIHRIVQGSSVFNPGETAITPLYYSRADY